MKQVGSADFRRLYASESDPVEVTAYGKVIGTWYPSGADLPTTPEIEQPVDEERGFDTPAPRMTIRPEVGPRREMVGTEKRVIDPLDFTRRREREKYSELHRQMYGGKTKSGPNSG